MNPQGRPSVSSSGNPFGFFPLIRVLQIGVEVSKRLTRKRCFNLGHPACSFSTQSFLILVLLRSRLVRFGQCSWMSGRIDSPCTRLQFLKLRFSSWHPNTLTICWRPVMSIFVNATSIIFNWPQLSARLAIPADVKLRHCASTIDCSCLQCFPIVYSNRKK